MRERLKLRRRLPAVIMAICLLLSGGCAGNQTKDTEAATEGTSEVRSSKPQVLETVASGEVVYEGEGITIDASNTADGYIMLSYTGTAEKVRFQITAPDGTQYTYPISASEDALALLLSGGDGSYQLTLYEAVSAEENLYAVAYAQTIEVTLSDEFAPFLHPNYYVNYTAESEAVALAQELAEGCGDDLSVVSEVYTYIISNISYDYDKAENVTSGYIPDIDDTLECGSGICFDYAALMTAMLRSQGIPTKLEVGYAGEIYHAWISCYVEEVGWVDHIIEFDGSSWKLMDPTMAAGSGSEYMENYTEEESNYIVKYTY